MKKLKLLLSLFVVGIFLVTATATGDDDSSTGAENSNKTVYNSSWDASVRQVEDYLESTLRDPDCYEGIEWSEVKETSNGYVVRHKYRAKNGFGGYVVSNQLFYMDSNGNVINVTDY